MIRNHATRPNILLGEDNAADVFLVKEALKQNRIESNLRAIGDGEAVLASIDRIDGSAQVEPINLVLLDLHLPKRDGAEILKHLCAGERSGQTPVVILTSSDSSTDQQNAEKHASPHYFRKPSSLSGFMELGGIVGNILGKYKPNDRISSGEQKLSGAA